MKLAAAITACLCTPALAATDIQVEETQRFVDALNPYVSVAYAYDSNIFRYDDEIEPVGGQSDQYATIGAGFDSMVQVSQQRYELSGLITQQLYNEHDNLDYTGGKATAIWHWSAGETSAGTLGYRFRRAMRDFANEISLDKTEDIRTEHQLLASGDFDLPGAWKVGVRGDVADISYDNSNNLDLQRTTLGANVGFVSGASNVIGLDAEFVTGDYDTNPFANFDEYTVGPTLEWQFTDRTQFVAKVGFTSRDNESPLREDYEGITGRVTVNMADNGRNQLKAELWRDLSNLGDEIADYAVVNGISVEPSWSLTDKLDLRINASYENRDFQVDPLEAGREDDVYAAGAFVDWEINRNFTVTFGLDAQRRSSTRELQDFEFNRFQIQVVGRL